VNTLDYIINKFELNRNGALPIEIPNYWRNDLGVLFKELEFTVGVEIGTQEGIYAKVLCNSHPELKLYCVDPYEQYMEYNDVSEEKLQYLKKQAKNYLAECNVEFIYKFSSNAVLDFEDSSLDFVYIDGNHRFEYVVEDISKWGKKIRVGGILSGHDYFKNSLPFKKTSVYEAVHGYTKAYRIRPWFVIGRQDMLSGEKRDKPRSWMWVKS